MNKISFYASDTRSPIEIINAALQKPVYLLNPFGKPYAESHYDANGYFQKQNVYALIAEWNKPEWCRDEKGRPISLHEKEAIGLSLAYDDYDHLVLKYPIKIVENLCDYDEADISPKNKMNDGNIPIIMRINQESAFRGLENIKKLHSDTESVRATDVAKDVRFDIKFLTELSLKADYKVSRILLDNPSTPYIAIRNIKKYAQFNDFHMLKKVAVQQRDLRIYEQLRTIKLVLSKLKMTDITVQWDYGKDCISARDDSNIWKGLEFYDFLLDEAIFCEKDGTPPLIIPDSVYALLESYRSECKLFMNKDNHFKASIIKKETHYR